MAWGGGGTGWDAFAPTGRFGGIPPELQERVDGILADEHHVRPETPAFSVSEYDRRPFTLRRFLSQYRARLVGALALVVVETLMLQAGPLLTQRAIDDGVVAGDKTVLFVIAGLYLATVLLGGAATMARIRVTGRVGARLMAALRIRLFSHLQRLSLDFYTREKAGVL